MAHEFKDISPNATAGAKVTNWFENRFPTAFDAYRVHMSEYYAPKNFNFWYIFGSLALLVLVIQIVTGIFLVMHYKPDAAKNVNVGQSSSSRRSCSMASASARASSSSSLKAERCSSAATAARNRSRANSAADG